jgi:hypothetical protein
LWCRLSFAPAFPLAGIKQRRHEPLSKPWSCHAVPMVRIRLPPAPSHGRTRSRFNVSPCAKKLYCPGRARLWLRSSSGEVPRRTRSIWQPMSGRNRRRRAAAAPRATISPIRRAVGAGTPCQFSRTALPSMLYAPLDDAGGAIACFLSRLSPRRPRQDTATTRALTLSCFPTVNYLTLPD